MSLLPPVLVILMVVPYLIAIAMPSAKWLSVFSVVFICMAGFILTQDTSSANGLAVAFGLVFLMGIGVITISGIIAKALNLFLKKRKFPRKITVLPLVLGLPLGIAIYLFPFKYHEWKERPVNDRCLEQTFLFNLEDVSFRLPPAPIFSLYFTKFSSLEAFKEGISLHNQSGVREACEQSKYGTKPITGTKITIILYNAMSSSAKNIHNEFCSSPTAEWEKELCAANTKLEDLDYPSKVFIYSPEAYLSSTASTKPIPTYKQYQSDISLTNAEDREKPEIGEDYVYAGHHYYWTSENPEKVTPDGHPFTLRCDASSDKQTVSCLTTYALTKKVNVQFSVRGSREEVPTKAWRQYKKLQSLLYSLIQD